MSMFWNPRTCANLFALIILPISGKAHCQSFQMPIENVLQGTRTENTDDVLKAIESKQKNAKNQINRRQLDLDQVRFNESNSPDAKASVLNLRQESLDQSRTSYAVLETAKLALTGQAIPASLAVYYPDVFESIASISNPILPLCGKELTYRGDSNQISWNLTLDKFLSKYGDLLGAVGRIEMDVATYKQGPSGPEATTVRVKVGTGFAINSNQVVTAGHVAAMFWDFDATHFRDRVRNVYFNPGGEHNFKCPNSIYAAAPRRLAKVSHTRYQPALPADENLFDYAVLDIAENEPALPRQLSVAKKSPAISTFVVVISYPADDPRVDRETWRSMMQVPVDTGMFPVTDIKRIAPGMVIPSCSNTKPVHLPHNATTLNHSSGAPIIAVDSGEVVGIQVAGFRDLGSGSDYCNVGLRGNDPGVSLQ